MARTITPLDGKVIMTALVRQATGQEQLTVTDMSSFVSAGETVLATGMENVYNALGIVIGRTIVAVRPYKARLQLIQAMSTDCYTSRLRKISFYSRNPEHSGMFNTDLYTNLKDGFTNGQNPNAGGTSQSLKSMWEQKQGMPFEMNFAGSTVWDECMTMYEEQIRAAFRTPDELARFVAGILTEHGNDIESQKEAFNRMTLLSRIGACYQYGEVLGSAIDSAINLTSRYNARFNTSWTSEELRGEHLKEFLAFFVAFVKELSDHMTERSVRYHVPMTKTVDGENYSILRHTPYDKQKFYLYEPLFVEASANVLPEIFRPEFLDIGKQYEKVNFWQANDTDVNRPKVSIKVPYYDTVSGTQKSTDTIELDYVVGLICDTDAMMTDYQLESAASTPLEARKMYRNTWLHMSKNAINDPTENAILLYMAD